MANYLELVNRCLDLFEQSRVSTLVSATGLAAKFKWMVNEAMRDIMQARYWRCREKEWSFQTVAPYSTGTVTIDAGTPTIVTGSGTSWSSSNVTAALARFRITNANNYYFVSTVDSATQLTLSSAHDSSAAAGSTYEIVQDIYNLGSDVDAIRSVRQFTSPLYIPIGEDTVMDEWQPDPTSDGSPHVVLFFGRNASGLVQVRLYPIPDSKFTVRLKGWRTFADMSADADTPGSGVIPDIFHMVFVWYAFLDTCRSGIADDPGNAAQVEKRLAVRYGQLITQDNPDTGRVLRMGKWEPTLVGEDNFLLRVKLPITS